jgi:hypothetical protein
MMCADEQVNNIDVREYREKIGPVMWDDMEERAELAIAHWLT